MAVGSLRVRVVSPFNLATDEIGIWDRLCRSDPALGVAFYSYAYVRTVAEVYPHVYVMVIERAGQPVGFLPHQYAGYCSKFLRAAQPVGGHMTDYFGLIANTDLRVHSDEVLRLGRVCSLLFNHLDETQLRYGLAGEKPELGLRIELTTGFQAYWAALREVDRRFVADTERRERKIIERFGPLRFEFHSTEPTSDLDHLIYHKGQQYIRTKSKDIFTVKWKRELLQKLCVSLDPLCSGVMSVLYAGDSWVASHFGISCNHRLHYWFPVYNVAMRDFSPGRLLIKSILSEALENGITIVDRGAGDAPAKRDFANSEHLYYRGLWMRPGVRALCSRLAMSAQWRIERLKESRKA